jgi:hypothetical protein
MCISNEYPEGNTHQAWNALTKQYESSDVGSDYVTIIVVLLICIMDGLVGDPDVCFKIWNIEIMDWHKLTMGNNQRIS